MSHSLNDDEFRTPNRIRRCPSAANIAHPISQTVNHESGNFQTA